MEKRKEGMGPLAGIGQRVQAGKGAENRAESCSLTACSEFYADNHKRVNEIPLNDNKVILFYLVIIFTIWHVKNRAVATFPLQGVRHAHRIHAVTRPVPANPPNSARTMPPLA